MKSPIEWLCAPKSASLSGALLFYKGASVNDALLSTVAHVNCHVYTQGARWRPLVLLGSPDTLVPYSQVQK
jgi:hypothetical protein